MLNRHHRHRLAVSLMFCVVLGGCQHLSSPAVLVSPFNKSALVGKSPSSAQPQTSDPLPADRKANVQIAVARGLERQGRTDEAKKIYLEITKAAPRRADAYHCLALLYDRKGECAQAQNYYRLALERDRENPELHCDCGYNAYLQQRWEEAEKSLRRAIVLAPELARAHTNLGMLLARTGRDDEALQEFARAGISEAEGRANLALAMTLSQRWNEAQAQYQFALSKDPNLAVAHQGLQTVHAMAAKQSGTTTIHDAPTAAWPVAQTAYHGP